MTDKPSYIHIDFPPLPDCRNIEETYGEICVKCNKCGRFGKSKRKAEEAPTNA